MTIKPCNGGIIIATRVTLGIIGRHTLLFFIWEYILKEYRDWNSQEGSVFHRRQHNGLSLGSNSVTLDLWSNTGKGFLSQRAWLQGDWNSFLLFGFCSGLDVLGEISLSNSRQSGFAKAAMECLLDSNLPAKYAMTGSLSANNIIQDGFYDCGPVRPNGYSKPIQCMCKPSVRDYMRLHNPIQEFHFLKRRTNTEK